VLGDEKRGWIMHGRLRQTVYHGLQPIQGCGTKTLAELAAGFLVALAAPAVILHGWVLKHVAVIL